MTTVTEGAPAPDFELETPDGPVSLADFAGKTVVLYFYPKDDTAGCTKEAQDFTALAPEFAKAGVTVLGVSKDSIAAHRKFATKYGLGVKLGPWSSATAPGSRRASPGASTWASIVRPS